MSDKQASTNVLGWSVIQSPDGYYRAFRKVGGKLTCRYIGKDASRAQEILSAANLEIENRAEKSEDILRKKVFVRLHRSQVAKLRFHAEKSFDEHCEQAFRDFIQDRKPSGMIVSTGDLETVAFSVDQTLHETLMSRCAWSNDPASEAVTKYISPLTGPVPARLKAIRKDE